MPPIDDTCVFHSPIIPSSANDWALITLRTFATKGLGRLKMIFYLCFLQIAVIALPLTSTKTRISHKYSEAPYCSCHKGSKDAGHLRPRTLGERISVSGGYFEVRCHHHHLPEYICNVLHHFFMHVTLYHVSLIIYNSYYSI